MYITLLVNIFRCSSTEVQVPMEKELDKEDNREALDVTEQVSRRVGGVLLSTLDNLNHSASFGLLVSGCPAMP